jgi:large subunit ribosomal protein L33
MAKKNENRDRVELKCTVCGNIIRPTEKNKANTPDKLEIKKYCSKCKKVQVFKEKK